jgi:hypothetical protein
VSTGDECLHGLTPQTCSICREGPTPRTEQSDAGHSQCRSCGADILWVITDKNHSRMPLDVEPTSEGRFIKLHVDPDGNKIVHALKNSELEPNTKPTYASHFQTCPDADEHRKSR